MFVYDFVPLGDAISQDEAKVKSTVTVVDNAAPPSEMPDAPDVNEHESDGITEGGLTPHNLASAVTPSSQYPPLPHDRVGDAIQEIVNDRVASSGGAAAREEAGHWGHGTMPIVEGIEPGISPAPFSNRYFAARPHAVESIDYMTPTVTDVEGAALASAAGVANSREASSPYDALIGW